MPSPLQDISSSPSILSCLSPPLEVDNEMNEIDVLPTQTPVHALYDTDDIFYMSWLNPVLASTNSIFSENGFAPHGTPYPATSDVENQQSGLFMFDQL